MASVTLKNITKSWGDITAVKDIYLNIRDNEFLFALIITTNNAVTLPVGLSLFHAEEGVLWHLISAAGIMIMLPMFVLATIIQKHFVQGMTMGAVR